MTKVIPLKISRAVRREVVRFLFGKSSIEELSVLDPGEMAVAACSYRIEAHLLWRIGELQLEAAQVDPQVEKLRGYLKARCLRNAARNLQRDAQVRFLASRLHTEGIPLMLIKGSALRARYGDLSGRPQCDSDVLIPRDALGRAEEILKEEGFQVDEKLLTREEYLDQHFDLRMIKNGNAVELHWAMSNECVPGAVERTWERGQRIDWGDVPVYLPSVADQIVFSQIHICRHLFSNAFRWMGDMLYELELWPDLLQELAVVREDWPPRMVYSPVHVASDFGYEPDPQARRMIGSFTGLDRYLLGSLARAAMKEKNFFGISHHHFNAALSQWLVRDRRTLLDLILQVTGEKLRGRSVEPWAVADNA